MTIAKYRLKLSHDVPRGAEMLQHFENSGQLHMPDSLTIIGAVIRGVQSDAE